MTEEQKIFAGKLFCPGDPALRALKLKAHNLCTRYNATFEDETEIRLPYDHRRAVFRQFQSNHPGRCARHHRQRL